MADILSLTLAQNAWGALFTKNQFAISVNDVASEDYTEQVDTGVDTPSGPNISEKPTDVKKAASQANVKKVNQRLDNISILDMHITERYIYPTQPTENGLVNKDTRIRMPITASVTIALPTANGDGYLSTLSNTVENLVGNEPASAAYNKVFSAIETAIKNNYKWTLLTKNKVYKNMYLEEMPTDITPENMNRGVYTLNFSENIVETKEEEKTQKPKDKKKSYLTKLGDTVKEKFNNTVAEVKKNVTMIKDKFDNLLAESSEVTK